MRLFWVFRWVEKNGGEPLKAIHRLWGRVTKLQHSTRGHLNIKLKLCCVYKHGYNRPGTDRQSQGQLINQANQVSWDALAKLKHKVRSYHPHSSGTNGVTRSYTSALRLPCAFGLVVRPMSRSINPRPPLRRTSGSSSPTVPRLGWLG